MDNKFFCDVLKENLDLATGCTEPAAIALCSAHAKKQLIGKVDAIEVKVSVNVAKNAFSVEIPIINRKGIAYAAALGAISGDPKDGLRIIESISKEDADVAVDLVDKNNVSINVENTDDRLHIEVTLRNKLHHSRCVIKKHHTNVTLLEKDGNLVFENNQTDLNNNNVDKYKDLNLERIYNFACNINTNTDDLEIVKDSIKYNSEIAFYGKTSDYNSDFSERLSNIMNDNENELFSAVACTACGVRTRMAGTNKNVVTNSGSGNQGIICTIPVLEVWKHLGKDEDSLIRAVSLSHLVSIYMHSNFGSLSAMCGAVIAATASACGIIFLKGGSAKDMDYCINNILGCISGIICDGAKESCAMKTTACCMTAYICADLALAGVRTPINEGIVGKSSNETIDNFTELSNNCSIIMDNTMIDIMMKNRN